MRFRLRVPFLSRAISCFLVWRTQGHTFQRPCIPMHKSAHVSLLSAEAFLLYTDLALTLMKLNALKKLKIYIQYYYYYQENNRIQNMCSRCSNNDRSLLSDVMQLIKYQRICILQRKLYIFICSFPFSLFRATNATICVLKKVLQYAWNYDRSLWEFATSRFISRSCINNSKDTITYQ